MTSALSQTTLLTALAETNLRLLDRAPAAERAPIAERARWLMHLAALARTEPAKARLELAGFSVEAVEHAEALAAAESEVVGDFSTATTTWRVKASGIEDERLEWTINGEILTVPENIKHMVEAGKKVMLDIGHCSGGDGGAVARLLELVVRKDAAAGACVHNVAASAGALLFACWPGVRRISAGGHLMLHAPTACVLGGVPRLRQKITELEAHIEHWIAVLSERTGQPRATVERWLTGGDVWFTAQEAVAAGLVDEIFEPAQVGG